MKVKTAELSGVQLDYAVAVAVNWGDGGYLARHMRFVPEYSTDWSRCGELISEYRVWLQPRSDINYASVMHPKGVIAGHGNTPQIAICRAVVASKLGDEADIPDELMESK